MRVLVTLGMDVQNFRKDVPIFIKDVPNFVKECTMVFKMHPKVGIDLQSHPYGFQNEIMDHRR